MPSHIYAGRPHGPLSRLPGSRKAFDRWEEGKKIKLLLAGYNGARNTGSDVRAAEIARQAREVFGQENVQVTVMTMDTSSMEGYFDPDVTLLPFSSLFPWTSGEPAPPITQPSCAKAPP